MRDSDNRHVPAAGTNLCILGIVSVIMLISFRTGTSALAATESPCQLHTGQMCTEPGEHYPWKQLERYIDDNRGMAQRMFGAAADPLSPLNELYAPELGEYRVAKKNQPVYRNPCVSDIALEQPYWSKNHKGQLRVIVNHTPFEQFVQLEKCLSTPDMDSRYADTEQQCPGVDCLCMQEYRTVRLVAYDPAQDEKGIFMDWFEFPCCCQCKCFQRGASNGTTAAPAERDLEDGFSTTLSTAATSTASTRAQETTPSGRTVHPSTKQPSGNAKGHAVTIVL